jgi:hypothetical protein
MLSKCANPGCPASFLYLHEGKLFRLDTGSEDPSVQSSSKTTQNLEFFWLCSDCASRLTLRYKRGAGVVTVPLPKAQARTAAAR